VSDVLLGAAAEAAHRFLSDIDGRPWAAEAAFVFGCYSGDMVRAAEAAVAAERERIARQAELAGAVHGDGIPFAELVRNQP
jgi:hypothetical protein